MADIDKPDEYTDNGDHFGEHVSKIIQLPFKRSLLTDLRGDGLVNVTNSGFLTGKNDYCLSGAIDDCSSLIVI